MDCTAVAQQLEAGMRTLGETPPSENEARALTVICPCHHRSFRYVSVGRVLWNARTPAQRSYSDRRTFGQTGGL